MNLMRVTFCTLLIFIVSINAADDYETCSNNQTNSCMRGKITRESLTSNDSEYFQITGTGSDLTLTLPRGFNMSLNKYVEYYIWSVAHPAPIHYTGFHGPICWSLGANRPADAYLARKKLLKMLFYGYEGCSDEVMTYQVPMELMGIYSFSGKNWRICKEIFMMVRISEDIENKTADLELVVRITPDNNALDCYREETTISSPTTPELTTLAPTTEISTTGVPESTPTPDDYETCSNNQTNSCMRGKITRESLTSNDSEYFQITGTGSDLTLTLPRGFNMSLIKYVEYYIWSAADPEPIRYAAYVGPICWLLRANRPADAYLARKKLLEMLFYGYEGCSDEVKTYRVPVELIGVYSFVGSNWRIYEEIFMMMRISEDMKNKIADLELVVRITPDNNALGPYHEETTISSPTIPELTTATPTTEISTTRVTTSEPKVTPTPDPKFEPTPTPNPEPTSESNVTPTPEPNSEPTPEANVTPTSDSESQSTPDPNSEPTPEPNVTPTSDPEPEPTPEPNSETTTEPNVTPTSDPEPEPTPEPNSETTTESNVTPTSDPEPEPTPEPNSETTTESNVTPASDPEPEPTPEPNSETTTESNVTPASDPEPEPTPQPNSETTTESNVTPASDPEPEPTPEPNSETTTESNFTPASDPEPEPTPQPNSETTPEPNVTPASDPESQSTPEPNSEPTSEPKSEPTSTPNSESTPEPSVTPTPDPRSEPELGSGEKLRNSTCYYCSMFKKFLKFIPKLSDYYDGLMRNQSMSDSYDKPKAGYPKCHYFTWLTKKNNSPSSTPSVEDFYVWLLENSCITGIHCTVNSRNLDQGYCGNVSGIVSTNVLEPQLASGETQERSTCPLCTWLKTISPKSIIRVIDCYDWLTNNGCINGMNDANTDAGNNPASTGNNGPESSSME